MGTGDWDGYPAITLTAYDPADGKFHVEWAPRSDSVDIMREIDGRLWVPHCDPIHYGDFADFSVREPDGRWLERTPLGCLHVFDACKLGDNLYICGAKDSHEGKSGGVLMRSADGGGTWQQTYANGDFSVRYYWCFSLKGKLWTQDAVWDGNSGSYTQLFSDYPLLYKPQTVAGADGEEFVLALRQRSPGILPSAWQTPQGMITFDGEEIRALDTPATVLDFSIRDGVIYVLWKSGDTCFLSRSQNPVPENLQLTDTALTGIPTNATALEIHDGCAWVGTRTGELWMGRLSGETSAPTGEPEVADDLPDAFGRGLALDGNRLAVGAPEAAAKDGVPMGGAVRTFTLNSGNPAAEWIETPVPDWPDPQFSGWMGKEIAVRDGVMAVLEAGYDGSQMSSRGSRARIHLYAEINGNWTLQTTIPGGFIQSIALTDTMLLAGSNNGTWRVFFWNLHRAADSTLTTTPGGWVPCVPSVNLYEPSIEVAADGDWLISAMSGDISRDGAPGALLLFKKSPDVSGWSGREMQKIAKASPERFGHSLSLHGGWLAAGAPRNDEAAPQAGAIYLYQIDPSAAQPLVERQKILCPVPQAEAGFGHSVSLRGDALLIGAPGLDVNGVTQHGAVWIYRLRDGIWTMEGQMPPPRAHRTGFGVKVCAGDRLLAAASRVTPRESPPQERLSVLPVPPLTPPVNGWEQWKARHGLSPAAGFHEDPDGDGKSNLTEYAGDGNPAVADDGTLFILHQQPDGSLVLSYKRRKNDERLRTVLESSVNLREWEPVLPTWETVQPLSDEFEAANVPVPGGGRRYFRLRHTYDAF